MQSIGLGKKMGVRIACNVLRKIKIDKYFIHYYIRPLRVRLPEKKYRKKLPENLVGKKKCPTFAPAIER